VEKSYTDDKGYAGRKGSKGKKKNLVNGNYPVVVKFFVVCFLGVIL